MGGNLREAPAVARPIGTVITKRLRLRRVYDDDVDALAALFEQPEVWHYPYGRGLTRAESELFVRQQVWDWENYGWGVWLAAERDHPNTIVGYVGLSIPRFYPPVLPAAEVGWRFAPSVWGRGYATEGARAALDEAFDVLELDEVWSIPQRDNNKSIAVAERLGLILDHVAELPGNERRGPVSGNVYRMDALTWRARRSSPG